MEREDALSWFLHEQAKRHPNLGFVPTVPEPELKSPTPGTPSLVGGGPDCGFLVVANAYPKTEEGVKAWHEAACKHVLEEPPPEPEPAKMPGPPPGDETEVRERIRPPKRIRAISLDW